MIEIKCMEHNVPLGGIPKLIPMGVIDRELSGRWLVVLDDMTCPRLSPLDDCKENWYSIYK